MQLHVGEPSRLPLLACGLCECGTWLRRRPGPPQRPMRSGQGFDSRSIPALREARNVEAVARNGVVGARWQAPLAHCCSTPSLCLRNRPFCNVHHLTQRQQHSVHVHSQHRVYLVDTCNLARSWTWVGEREEQQTASTCGRRSVFLYTPKPSRS